MFNPTPLLTAWHVTLCYTAEAAGAMPHTAFDDLYMNTKRKMGTPWLKRKHRAVPQWLIDLRNRKSVPAVAPKPVNPRDVNPWDPRSDQLVDQLMVVHEGEELEGGEELEETSGTKR